MAFNAHDVNQAYYEGVRHEQKRILAIIHDIIIKGENRHGDAISEYKWWEKQIQEKDGTHKAQNN